MWSTIIGRQFAYEYARHSLLLVKLVYRRLLNPTIHPHRSPRHRRTRVACVAACSTAVLSSHSTLPSTALQTGGDSAAAAPDILAVQYATRLYLRHYIRCAMLSFGKFVAPPAPPALTSAPYRHRDEGSIAAHPVGIAPAARSHTQSLVPGGQEEM